MKIISIKKNGYTKPIIFFEMGHVKITSILRVKCLKTFIPHCIFNLTKIILLQPRQNGNPKTCINILI